VVGEGEGGGGTVGDDDDIGAAIVVVIAAAWLLVSGPRASGWTRRSSESCPTHVCPAAGFFELPNFKPEQVRERKT
jgi:hypothetical protein